MWWTSENQDDRRTGEIVAGLTKAFLSESIDARVIHAVGSTVRQGRRVPLLILDKSLEPIADSRPEDVFDDWFGLFNPKPVTLGITIDKAADVRSALKSWDLPVDTVLRFSPPIMPAVSRVWAGKENATIGFQLSINGTRVFTTAGHLAPVVPSLVSTRERGWFRGHTRQDGRIWFAHDPIGAHPGIDIALVDGVATNASQPAAIADPANVGDLARVAMAGGRSGDRIGWVDGALNVSRSFDGRCWENCWSIQEYYGGFAQPGDSGAGVITKGPAGPLILGQLVAVFGAKRVRGRRQSGLVQDISSVLRFLHAEPRVMPASAAPVQIMSDDFPGVYGLLE